MVSYSEYIYTSFNRFWGSPFICDYPNNALLYKDVALKIMQIHQTFRKFKIEKGDKIALCGPNSSNWAITYLAITSYGTVAVPLLTDFTDEKKEYLLKHSEAKLFFTDEDVCGTMHPENMFQLEGIYSLNTFELILSKRRYAVRDIKKIEMKDFSKEAFVDDVYRYEPDELVSINYTSGSMSNPKGVMIPSRAIASNISFALDAMYMLKEGDKSICLLPMSHMFGIMYDFLSAMVFGAVCHFPVNLMSMKEILKMYQKVKPCVVITVPMVIESLIRNNVFKYIHNPYFKPLYGVLKPLVDKLIAKRIKSLFGGNFYQIIIGGAYLDKEVEDYLKELKLPFMVGYGMTECSPIIAYNDYHTFVKRSSGKAAPRMEIRISDEEEVLTRGDNVMLGYYKNDEATKEAFTSDGWMRTGDVGELDDDGNLYIKGRLKSTIIGSDGKNINPEEVEEIINRDKYIEESFVFEEGGKLLAYVYPKFLDIPTEYVVNRQIYKFLNERRVAINEILPYNEQIAEYIIMEKPFEKTPKMTIKRYLY